jgi:uncharacterized membrane protein YfcA
MRQLKLTATISQEAVLREGILLYRLATVAIAGYASEAWPNDLTGLTLAFVLCAVPFSVLAPARWSNKISEKWYYHWILPLSLNGGLIVVAAASDVPPAPFPRTVPVMTCAALYLLWLTRRIHINPVERTPLLWDFVATGIVGVAGVYLDLHDGIGWHTLSYALYGFTSHRLLSGLTREPPNWAALRA